MRSYSSSTPRDGTRRILSPDGSFNLLASVVLQALDDLKRAEPKRRADAWVWLTSDNRDLCSFHWYCVALSMNRALLLRIAAENYRKRLL